MPGRAQLHRRSYAVAALLAVLLHSVRRKVSFHSALLLGSRPRLLIDPATALHRPRGTRASVELAASRRDVIIGAGAGISSGGASKVETQAPVCEMPLHRLKPLPGQVGGQFASVSATLQGSRVELMLDSGLSEGMVTPAIAKQMRLQHLDSAQGEGAGGSAQVEQVEVADLTLECGEKLAPITAAVADFPQASADKALPLSGMLGFRSLASYDVDIDFRQGKFRLWRAGDGVATARAAGMREVEGVLLPDFGILGVRVMVPGGGGAAAALGIVDTGSAFSAVNKAAASALSVAGSSQQEMMALGVDGKPMKLPLVRDVVLPLGGAQRARGGWDEAVVLKADSVAVGDLPALETLVGDRRRPSVLLGLDVLGQNRIMFAASSNDKKQQLFIVAP